jgi:hypothetical protein
LDYDIKRVLKQISSHDFIAQSSRVMGFIGVFIAFVLSFIDVRLGLQNFISSIILITIYLVRASFLRRFVRTSEDITTILDYTKRSYLFRLFTWLEYSYEYDGSKYRFRGYVFDPNESAKYMKKGERILVLISSRRPDKSKIVGSM